MLREKPPQTSFYGSYLYDRIVPQDHLLRKINAVVDFSFVNELVRDRYTPDFGRPAEDPDPVSSTGQGLCSGGACFNISTEIQTSNLYPETDY